VARRFISQEYSTENRGKNLKEGTKRSRTGTVFAAGFFSFSVIIGICLITFSVMFFFAGVNGKSMMLTLNASGQNTDSVLVNRHASANIGDITVFRHNDRHGKFDGLHIKRLLGRGGDSIHFRHVTSPENRFVIEVNGIEYDNNLYQIHGNNSGTIQKYIDFHNYQQGTNLPWGGGLPFGMREENRDDPHPGFRTHSRNGTEFRQFNNLRNRYEITLPHGYIFFMGDNRGGHTTSSNPAGISSDSADFGPQPASRVIGVVVQEIPNMTAMEWLWSRFVHIVTFRWI